MSFNQYLTKQLELHPAMQYQDFIKLCYQAAFGMEHLLENRVAALKFLEEEYISTPAENIALYEEISDDYMRINLGAWKYRGLPIEWLFTIFTAASGCHDDNTDRFNKYLQICREKITETEEWDKYIFDYNSQGIRPVHHSENYRRFEKPAYRLVHKKFLRLLPVLELAVKCDAKPCVIVIEGRAASGKTSLGEDLSSVLGADVVHMDDFFLPPELRTETRRNEIGGNIHYERFSEEVVPNIKHKDSFSYRVFSCSSMGYSGVKEVSSTKYRIVEGVYSLHPHFGNYADICVFSDVDPALQIERILKRDGSEYAEMFSNMWIPMEESYFKNYNIEEKCTVSIKNK